jgi:hypothetical protein
MSDGVEKIDAHFCMPGEGRSGIELWTRFGKVEWWLIGKYMNGGGTILFCPYCGLELPKPTNKETP